ncbi:MAG TPA: LuxR family transcriptional regulator [Actinomycetales bacterium]|nr:LuxR family transcriptional regulator [Actinomycetales bacterium]
MDEEKTGGADSDAQRRRRDLASVRSAIAALREATGIPVTIGGVVGEGHTLVLSESLGMRTSAMKDLKVHYGAGVGGRVMATGKPLGVADYQRAGVITHEYDLPVLSEGLRSMAAIPVVVGKDIRAVLYAGVHSSVRFGEKVLSQMAATARALEQEIAVNDALAARGAAPVGPGSGEGRWDDVLANERMRETHARLRMLASRTDDEDVRAELERICAEMVAAPPETPTARLSRRELDVLACVAQGKTNIEAAADMGIGAETVKSYLRSVMRKLDAHTRFEAVNAARRMGVLP